MMLHRILGEKILIKKREKKAKNTLVKRKLKMVGITILEETEEY